MALTRARKSSLLELARHVLLDPPLVAVGALTRADVPSMTLARKEYRKHGLALKKLPNRLCELAVRSSERAFLSSIFSGDLVVLYPADDETNASTLAKRLLDGTAGASNVHLIGGALDANLLFLVNGHSVRVARMSSGWYPFAKFSSSPFRAAFRVLFLL